MTSCDTSRQRATSDDVGAMMGGMTRDDPRPVLAADRLYVTPDALVCGRARCAGLTALYTGRTLGDDAVVRPFTPGDADTYRRRRMAVLCRCGTLRWDYDADAPTLNRRPH